MGLRRCFMLLLLVGFSLSIHGRMEPDFKATHVVSEFHASDLSHQHSDSPQLPSNPTGAHKDQHGCYHSHAPFVIAHVGFNCEAASSELVAAVLKAPWYLISKTILHPPRA